MVWFEGALDRLAAKPCCGYQANTAPATEATALAAMALSSRGREKAAAQALDWLARLQQPDGSLGIDEANRRPPWPSGWALLAWQTGLASLQSKSSDGQATAKSTAERQSAAARWSESAQRAVRWILASRGREHPRSEYFGHDPTIQAWPWTEQTQSWVQPTAMHLLALKRSGLAAHPRCREAVAMLLDRMLPEGGWNYGNTVVLGATLGPHVEPTGLALAALAGEPSAAAHVQKSLRYLERSLNERTTTMSLCYGLLGGAAHGWRPPSAGDWLEAAYHRTIRRDASPHRLALLVLAASKPCPWYGNRGERRGGGERGEAKTS